MTPTVVHARLDALTLAFRIELDPALVASLEEAAEVAKVHGEAELAWGPVVGAVKYSRGEKKWLVTNARWRACFTPRAKLRLEGGKSEPGWTTEIVWSAQSCAELGCASLVAETCALAESIGKVFAVRDRRFDLCADVAGIEPTRDMAERLVKAARCEHHDYPFDEERVADEVEAGANVYWLKKVTGFRAGHGDVVLRVYNKRIHLQARAPEHRVAEEERWRRGGWDGEAPVTRVELQLRGTVLSELGVRDPRAPVDPETGEVFAGLHEVLDRVWRRFVRLAPEGKSRGFRLTVVDDPEEKPTLRATDPLWEVVRRARFGGAPGEQTRVRVRGGASVEQCVGCDLSLAASRGELARVDVARAKRVREDKVAARAVRLLLRRLALLNVATKAEHLIARFGPKVALEHLAVITNAKVARFDDPLARALARAAPPPMAACA